MTKVPVGVVWPGRPVEQVDAAILGVIRDPGDLFRCEPQVERVQDTASRGNTEVALEVRVVIPAERRDTVALLQPGSEQRGCQLA